MKRYFTLIPLALLLTFFIPSAFAQLTTAEAEIEISVYPKVTKLENGNINAVLKEFKGDVVVLNIWATWCVPCVKEMPDLLKIREVYQEKGVKLVLLSVDDPADIEPKVYPFLMQQGIDFETYIRTGDDDQAFVNGIDESWSGAIPLTLIYDRKGNKNTIIFGNKHFEDFEKYVKPLL